MWNIPHISQMKIWGTKSQRYHIYDAMRVTQWSVLFATNMQKKNVVIKTKTYFNENYAKYNFMASKRYLWQLKCCLISFVKGHALSNSWTTGSSNYHTAFKAAEDDFIKNYKIKHPLWNLSSAVGTGCILKCLRCLVSQHTYAMFWDGMRKYEQKHAIK